MANANMLEIISTYIEQHQLLPVDGTLIIAVSGGADSLCLLHLLHQLCGPDRRYPASQLHVAHLNHQLRGSASEHDAQAVACLAETWGLPCTIGAEDVPALAQREQRSLEDAARTARYRFLRAVAQGNLIAVAHHMDDQAETLMLHWLRGGGIASMIGLQPRQQDIIRPLLAVSHADTLAYCAQHQLIPLEDASNGDTRFLRNRIRHEILPLLTSINPGIRATLLRTAEIMQVDYAWIEQKIDTCWPTVIDTIREEYIRLQRSTLHSLPLSLQRHLLRRVTAQLCGGQSPLELRHYKLIEQLLQQAATGETLTLHLPQQLHAILDKEHLVFTRGHGSSPFKGSFFCAPPSGAGGEGRSGDTPETLPGAQPLDPVALGRRRALGGWGEETSIILAIPGRVAIPGTDWAAIAEPVAEEVLQEVQQALHDENWHQVWDLLANTRYSVYIDSLNIGTSLVVRTRQPGDRIRPLGMAHEKKVQDILVDKHIPRTQRDKIQLFFSSQHCLWLAGICIDDRVRLTSTTRQILRLAIEPL